MATVIDVVPHLDGWDFRGEAVQGKRGERISEAKYGLPAS
jgi:hypothetical protein